MLSNARPMRRTRRTKQSDEESEKRQSRRPSKRLDNRSFRKNTLDIQIDKPRPFEISRSRVCSRRTSVTRRSSRRLDVARTPSSRRLQTLAAVASRRSNTVPIVSASRSRVSKHITPLVNPSFRNLHRIFPEPLGKSTVHAAAHIQYISRPQQQLWPPISQLQNKSPTLLSAMILSPYASAAGVIPRLSDNTRNEPTQKLCAAAGNKTNQSGS